MTVAHPIRDMKSAMFASLVALVFAALICNAIAQPAPLFPPKKQKKIPSTGGITSGTGSVELSLQEKELNNKNSDSSRKIFTS